MTNVQHVRYWPVGKGVPEGTAEVHHLGHHSAHSVLIVESKTKRGRKKLAPNQLRIAILMSLGMRQTATIEQLVGDAYGPGAPPNSRALVIAAVGRLRKTTAMKIVTERYDGTTSYRVIP